MSALHFIETDWIFSPNLCKIVSQFEEAVQNMSIMILWVNYWNNFPKNLFLFTFWKNKLFYLLKISFQGWEYPWEYPDCN